MINGYRQQTTTNYVYILLLGKKVISVWFRRRRRLSLQSYFKFGKDGIIRYSGYAQPAVIWLSRPKLYSIVANTCECERFGSHNICHHTIAAAADSGEFVHHVTSYRPPSVDSIVSKRDGKTSGNKPGRQRVPLSQKEQYNREDFVKQFRDDDDSDGDESTVGHKKGLSPRDQSKFIKNPSTMSHCRPPHLPSLF